MFVLFWLPYKFFFLNNMHHSNSSYQENFIGFYLQNETGIVVKFQITKKNEMDKIVDILEFFSSIVIMLVQILNRPMRLTLF